MASIAKRSPLAGTWGEALAEFFGTLVLILFGDGCVATFQLFTNTGPNGAATPFANSWVVIILGWGLAVMLGIYVAGAISGAHLNPAVTISQAVTGRLPWRKVIPYIVAQVVGAFVAAGILYFVYKGAIDHALGGKALDANTVSQVGGVFYTGKKDFVGVFGAFGTELIGTALLVGLILAITDGRNQPVQANLNPMIIGFLIVAIGASFGLNSGYAINPARDFGPRLWMALVGGGFGALNDYTWIPIVAPIVGGIIGALIYDFSISKVLAARHMGQSGDTETKGEAVRERSHEPSVQ
ncbi:glycerol uptake facilitator protein [Thermosporothrix hazakensis]|jgi:glycerol uptake facilitator protein|uniref:Glycerol uptake facilitator protein n=2 Tax=Thermosporothrix TaxID=768650 RepID=A0A326UDC0_THEHA|nr:MIP family channel protein [Thermosporothrix hazakensis]PZW27386.1 glycerol uptake facilitator protein [Thermosporothrix hazakensis]BBH86018.1 aquaporin [Thermosporothrix sp. COM3]GCE45555.1 aquaporin [Thermosporothrix hazakensis]